MESLCVGHWLASAIEIIADSIYSKEAIGVGDGARIGGGGRQIPQRVVHSVIVTPIGIFHLERMAESEKIVGVGE